MAAPINWVPANVDIEEPNAARVYDYWLGGAHNSAVDREFSDRVADVVPANEFARMNPALLRQVARYPIIEAEVHKFFDLG